VSPAPTSSPAVAPAPGRPVRTAATAAAVVAVAVHLWGLYRDHGPPSVGWFPQADKLQHLVGFGLPCFLVLLALHLHVAAAGRLLATRTVGLVVGLFVLHAVVSEVVQGDFYTSRSGDPYDALADVAGTLLGLAAYVLVRRRGSTLGAKPGRTTRRAAHGGA
jgi:VanZ family protein